MADKRQNGSEEPLTERDRQALQELARQIVREAGLGHSAERKAAEEARKRFVEGGIENYKAAATYSQNMATLSGATLAGAAVITKTLIPDPNPGWAFTGSLLLLFFAAMFSSLNFHTATTQLRRIAWGDIPDDPAELERFQEELFVRPTWTTRGERRRFLFTRDLRYSLVDLFYYVGLFFFLRVFLESAGVFSIG